MIKLEKKSVLKIFQRFKFLQKQKVPKICTFDQTLTPTPVSTKRLPKSKKINKHLP